MAGISSTLVKTLREKTGAGVIACKNALVETQGDFEAAVDRLRAAEASRAAAKADRVAAEGLVSLVVGENRARLSSSIRKRILPLARRRSTRPRQRWPGLPST